MDECKPLPPGVAALPVPLASLLPVMHDDHSAAAGSVGPTSAKVRRCRLPLSNPR